MISQQLELFVLRGSTCSDRAADLSVIRWFWPHRSASGARNIIRRRISLLRSIRGAGK